MIKPTLVHLFEALAALLVAAILFFQWQEGRADKAELRATLEQQKTLIAQAQLQAQQLQKDIASRDSAAQSQITALQSQLSHLQTPAEIVPWLASSLNKQVPQPITITAPAPSTSPQQGGASVVTAQIPQQDLQSIRDLVGQAQQDKIDLQACEADKADLQNVVKQDEAQIMSVTKERDSAIKAAKGGSFFRRTARALKYVGIGIGVGALLAHGI